MAGTTQAGVVCVCVCVARITEIEEAARERRGGERERRGGERWGEGAAGERRDGFLQMLCKIRNKKLLSRKKTGNTII